MKTVICPLTGNPICGAACLLIVQVVDGELHESVLQGEVTLTEEGRRVCAACKYHADEA